MSLKINQIVKYFNKAIYPKNSVNVPESKIDEIYSHLREEQTRIVPRPIENIKLNDLKNVKSSKSQLPVYAGVKYMPDIMAEKLVNDLMDKK